MYAGSIQDNWSVSSRVTISAGLRYAFPQAWHDRDSALNRLGTLDISPASQAVGGRFLLAGSPNYYIPGTGVVDHSGAPAVRASLVDPSWRDFQPRVGMAWRPFRDNRTAIRAGFGIYYALQDANSLAFEMLSPPFSFPVVIANLPPTVPVGQPLHDSQLFPAVPPSGVATEGNDPRNQDPNMYQWTASVERQVSGSLLFAAEYLGNHGIHNPFTILVNTPPHPTASQLAQLETNPALNASLAQLRAPFPNVSLGYQYIENVAQSWYQALNLRAEGRLSTRLNFSAVYTWSKALDMASAEQQMPLTIANLELGKSYADYDHPQRFVGSWVYELPDGGRFANAVWRKLASGWEISGIATFEAGPPYSVNMGVDTSFTGGSAPGYPNMTGPPVYAGIRQSNGIYLTPANFAAAPFGQFGQLARNAFHGPGVNNFDLGFIKNTAISEHLRVQLRCELFNAFNHAQFAFAGSSLATSMSAPAAGATLPVIQYTDASQFRRAIARAPRVVQFGLKLVW